MSANTTPSDQAELVRRWMIDQLSLSEELQELPGAHVEETEGGVVIRLDKDLELDTFVDAVDGFEMENPRFDQVHLAVGDVEGNVLPETPDAVNVYEVQDLGNGRLARFKVGKTYRDTDTFALGTEPMGANGEPNDDIVEDVLLHLSLYLAHKYWS